MYFDIFFKNDFINKFYNFQVKMRGDARLGAVRLLLVLTLAIHSKAGKYNYIQTN